MYVDLTLYIYDTYITFFLVHLDDYIVTKINILCNMFIPLSWGGRRHRKNIKQPFYLTSMERSLIVHHLKTGWRAFKLLVSDVLT